MKFGMGKILIKILIIPLFLICLSLTSGGIGATTTDELITRLHSHDERVQMAAVKRLDGIKDKRVVNELLRFLSIEAENWKVKIKVIDLLGEINDPEVSDKLVTFFNNPFLNQVCPAMKRSTALALGKKFNKGTRAVDSLIGDLDSDDILVREAIIQSLGKIGDPTAVPFIIRTLDDKKFAIRLSAVKALGDIGDPEAIPSLKKVVSTDHDPYIRQAARSALQDFRHD
jgi:HEAT repeat protein